MGVVEAVMQFAFSILTSDRGTATRFCRKCKLPRLAFQYPDLGSWDCNMEDYVIVKGAGKLSVS